MLRVRTAIVSDLHLGTVTDADLARAGEPRERLLAALDGADRVVLLGDTLELRELPFADVLERARPFLEALGEVSAGREVVLVPGNHDYQFAQRRLEALMVDGEALGPANVWDVQDDDGPPASVAGLMPRTELKLAYPGLMLRPDVYAIHGHYLDLHMTVPRPEGLTAALLGLITGHGRDSTSAAGYEAVLGPMYAFYSRLAESANSKGVRHGSSLSRNVWRRLNGEQGGPVGRFLLGRVAIPGGVAVLNRLGLGPLGADVSGVELRRAGLRAIGRVIDGLGIDAEHVVFGHTHRAGPLEGDDRSEWRTPRGARLWNSGSWLYEPVFVSGRDPSNPYWPGTVIHLDDQGDPRVENVLRSLAGAWGEKRDA
jgi:Calcineurin-like phosphoesterase